MQRTSEHVYLPLAYPILNSKYVTVGLIEDTKYEVGVLFTQHKRNRMLLDFPEWNYLMIFHERNLKHMQMCEEGEERENKKIVKRTRKNFVHIIDSSTNRFVFSNSEWVYFSSLLQLLNKYIIRLFYDQEYFKSYIEGVVTAGAYVEPQFYFPTFFNTTTGNRLDNQLTFDRLFDELRMRGKVVGGLEKADVIPG